MARFLGMFKVAPWVAVSVAVLILSAEPLAALNHPGRQALAEGNEGTVPAIPADGGAELLLENGRTKAAVKNFPQAASFYRQLLAQSPNAMMAAGDGLYLPMWSLAANDLAAWPPEGLKVWRTLTDLDAREACAAAVASGNLARLEQAAQRYLLNDAGRRAAIGLADRLREAGLPVLALYYYNVVLEKSPPEPAQRTEVQVHAALAAREAGLDQRYDALAAALRGQTVKFGEGREPEPADKWLAAQRPLVAQPELAAGGLGNVSAEVVAPPREVGWRTVLDTFVVARMLPDNTPVVYATYADDTLYLISRESLFAFESATGKLRWRFDAGPRLDDFRGETFQVYQATVADGVVYAPLATPVSKTEQNMPAGRVELFAIRVSDGKKLWSWRPQALNLDGQPVIAGDRVFVGLDTGTLLGDMQMAALDRTSGRLVWRQALATYVTLSRIGSAMASNNGVSNCRDSISSSLAARGGIVFCGNLGITCAANAVSGNLLWCHQLADLQQLKPVVFCRRPRLLADRGLVVSGWIAAPNVEAYDWLDGRRVWSQKADGAWYPAALDGERLVTWGNALAARRLADGAPLWAQTVRVNGAIAGEPAVAGGKVFVSTDQTFYTIDLASGKVLSQMAMPGPASQEPPKKGLWNVPFPTGGNVAVFPGGVVVTSTREVITLRDRPAGRP